MARWSSLACAVLVFTLAPHACAQWTSGGVRLPYTPVDQWALVSDGAGGALALYQAVPDYYTLRSFHVLADGSLDPADGDTGRVVAKSEYGEGLILAIGDDAGGMLVSFLRCGPIMPHVRCWENGSYWLQHSAAGAAVPAWPDTGIDLGASTGPSPPLIVTDGAGGAIALMGACVNRWTSVGATPWTADAGQPGVLVSTGTAPKLSLVHTGDGDGGAWALWAEEYPIGSSTRRIRLNHVSAAGQRVLGNAGLALITDTDLRPCGMAPDGTGGVFVAWSSPAVYADVPVDSVFVQHFDATGIAWWDAAGVPAGHIASGYSLPMWAAGDDDVAFVVLAGLSLVDRRVRKISQGALAWPGLPDGIRVGVPGLPVWGPLVLPGEAGALFLAWSDTQEGVSHPRVTLLDASGKPAPGWTLSGTRLSGAPDDGLVDALIRGANPGEAIVGWTRPDAAYPSLSNQVLQKVVSGGVLAAPPPPPALALAAPWPNPSHDGWTVRFSMPGPGEATVELFDVAGRRVRAERVTGASAGPREARLDGRGLAPGVYRVRLRAVAGERTHAVLLVR